MRSKSCCVKSVAIIACCTAAAAETVGATAKNEPFTSHFVSDDRTQYLHGTEPHEQDSAGAGRGVGLGLTTILGALLIAIPLIWAIAYLSQAGASGLELLLPLTLKWGEEMGLKPVESLAAVTSRAAAVLGVEAGSLQLGAPADICLYDPAKPWVVLPSSLASQGKNTPFSGFEVIGRVTRTIVGGRSVHIE